MASHRPEMSIGRGPALTSRAGTRPSSLSHCAAARKAQGSGLRLKVRFADHRPVVIRDGDGAMCSAASARVCHCAVLYSPERVDHSSAARCPLLPSTPHSHQIYSPSPTAGREGQCPAAQEEEQQQQWRSLAVVPPPSPSSPSRPITWAFVTSTVNFVKKGYLRFILSSSIMPDCPRNIFNEKEDFQVVLGKGNSGESSCQQHTKWMAHWTRASSSAYRKSCSPLEDANDSTCHTENFETSLFELKKSSVTEGLMLGGNHEGIFMEKLNSNMWGVSHDVRQEAEQKKNEQPDESFQSSVMQMQKNENFYAKTVVSETLSVCRLSDLQLDFQKLVNSDENPALHWNQLPMLSSNQQVDSIINPGRRSATGTVFDDLFVPQKNPKLDMVMDHSKPSGDIMYLLEDPTCLISDHAGKKLKVDNNSSSDCGMDEQGTGHYSANPNQEPLGRCGGKQFNLSENSDKGQTVGGASQNQKSRTPAGLHKKEVAAGVVLSLPVLGNEYEGLPINYFMNSNQDDEDFYVESHLISDRHHNLNTHRMQYAENVTDSCMLPDPVANIFAINSKGGAVIPERQPVDNFTDSQQNGSCLFEMLTVPSKSQSTYPIDSLSSCSHLFGAQNQFSHKTRTMHRDAQYVSKSSAGIASSLMQKDNGCAERANEQMATEIMDLDPPLFQSRMINQVLNDAIRPPTGAEPSDKWLERLLHDTADPHAHRSKRAKIGDCRPVGVSDTDIVDHVEARCVRCWLGRLCRGGVAPVSHGEPGQGTRAATEPDVAARELGGHFPSIKAMAMMGRVMSKVRPFDRQRKGPCVMWKADEGA